jgi:3-methyladenine DNA glycosylase/8-oxoguanine DNA glycosylase
MSTLHLTARQPFNFLSVVNSHGWVQLAPMRFDEASQVLFYTDRLSNGRVLEYRIAAASKGVKVETTGKLGKSEQKEAAEKVTWMLGLDMDFSAFYKAARKEPKLRAAEKLARGRVLRSPTFFEDVVKTILTTNTLWAATIRMNLNLIATFGDASTLRRAQGDASLTVRAASNGSTGPSSDALSGAEGAKAFPTPERIAASRPEVLRETVRVGYRAPAIHELATRVASGELDLESFKTSPLPTLELRQELLKIRGVGPYAAANLLMLLGRHDFIPIDSWALKVVSHEWYRGKPVTAKEVERRFAKWGEFKGLAYWFWDWKYKYNGGG